ncbi:MAG: hypothetical protein GY811_23340 [Myxococcales bacterium]|nr:hypothetical protein [Myxococcales bacterium]
MPGTKTVVSQEKPVSIPAGAGAGIKPGAFLVIARSKEKSSEGIPHHVYKSKVRAALPNFYGLPLVR